MTVKTEFALALAGVRSDSGLKAFNLHALKSYTRDINALVDALNFAHGNTHNGAPVVGSVMFGQDRSKIDITSVGKSYTLEWKPDGFGITCMLANSDTQKIISYHGIEIDESGAVMHFTHESEKDGDKLYKHHVISVDQGFINTAIWMNEQLSNDSMRQKYADMVRRLDNNTMMAPPVLPEDQPARLLHS